MKNRPRDRLCPAVPSLVLLAIVALAAPSAAAQDTGIGLPGQTRDKPLEIDADNGIEWQQGSQAYIARGNVRAVQGDVVIYSDVMTAFYRKTKTGGTEIWRIDANGDVRITTPTQTAYGDKAVYDVDDGVLVLTGGTRLVTETDRITARDSLEFWERKNFAVARGNAIASRGENRLRADVLTAYFVKDEGGKSKVERINAFDNVLVSSPTEIVRARQGVYNLETGIVVLSGEVKMTRGDDQLNGEHAEMNLNTGISRMLGSDQKGVRGYFAPRPPNKPTAPRKRRGS